MSDLRWLLPDWDWNNLRLAVELDNQLTAPGDSLREGHAGGSSTNDYQIASKNG